MKDRTLRWAALIVAAAALIIAGYSLFSVRQEGAPAGSVSSKTFTVYERVIEKGEIRVGYLVLPPFLDKKSSTGAFTGIFYDFMEEIGRRLDLKVVWVEEVNLANMSVGLETRRYDMVAFPLWRNAARAKTMAFSPPLFYAALGVYVRADDTRFDADLSLLNSEDVRVSTIDGEVAENIAREDFPLAKHVALPQFSDYTQLLLQVQTGKADVTFFDKVFAQGYLAQNPGKLKDISGDRPIRVFAQTFIPCLSG